MQLVLSHAQDILSEIVSYKFATEKVPSFVLETQEYRAKMMLSDALSDGSMELFCNALQFLVDSPEILNSA
jgi:hypothetical protein